MKNRNEFDQRIGRFPVPTADIIPRLFDDLQPTAPDLDLKAKLFKRCSIKPLQGCYRLTFFPKSGLRPTLFATTYKGTMRFEEKGSEIIVSADLYKFKTIFPLKYYRISQKYKQRWGHLTIGEEAQSIGFGFRQPEAPTVGPAKLPPVKTIPIYPRNRYYSYLQGVSAQLSSIGFVGRPCNFSLTFDEFFYVHPASGFDGSFPAVADRTIRMQLKETDKADYFEGKLYSGDSELGSIRLEWVSPFFRRAELKIQRLEGAVIPQPVTASSGTGTEDFSSIFATAGWHLSVTRDDTAVALPASLAGVQDPDTCWNPNFDNMHDLMDSLPGYDPGILDSRWKAYLVAIPAALGCSRGWMFDSINSGGDVNSIGREGAVTHSHDGYPSGDGVEYGIAENELQKDHPRAFLRSAAHEVGHTFNQIHQSFESGSDNSIMTVTPAVASVLDGAGETFPDDIDLAFNATVQRHLIHLPDPAVRPGAMQFFGNSISVPESDVNFFDTDDLELVIKLKTRVKLGEPVNASWTLTNRSDASIPTPDQIDTYGHAAHISVTNPAGAIRYMKSVVTAACSSHPVSALKAGASRKAEATLFWSQNGFAFDSPGRHRVEVILLWDVDGLILGARGGIDVWVDYPITTDDNAVAALLLNEEVGKLVAMGVGVGRRNRYPIGLQRAAEVLEKHPEHPACDVLGKLLKGSYKKGKAKRNK
ncbi:hypothetical protein [Neptunomonas qingdaonensis]|uniref:Uncharacterized protein n=1 Tax=Neptunomonas qingdaonensis TaxID=1045558 RepID=A0A1I2S2Y6_9GAMM|nr:hypothetical protein [Neptunomonas qingdaonensis]SFG47234.1 hypothetical protein SAMN05216175_10792 [Neptunomonas qingdaonensis]